MGGWLDPIHVNFLEFFKILEHVPQLALELFLFLGRELNPREVGDVVDVHGLFFAHFLLP